MATYKPLQSISLSATTSSITFSGIDQNYTDLVLVSSISVTTGTPVVRLLVNSDTNSNYSRTGMYGDGSTATGYKETSAANLQLVSIVDNFTPLTLHFGNYSNITTNKAIFMRTGITYPGIQAGLYRSTSAINALTLNLSASTFEPGSTFSLYGIKSGAPQALGGDVVATDGNYWYHAFRTTQTFTPQRNLTADVVVVAGGGGGGGAGNGIAGGGGAGGFRILTSQTFTSNVSYTTTIGAGGAGGLTSGTLTGSSGTNSSVIGTSLSLSSTGGGRGAAGNGATLTPLTGGSGGGAQGQSQDGAVGNAGGYSPVEGYKGGNGNATGDNAGGGGGAGGNGSNGVAPRSIGGGPGGIGAGGTGYTNYAIINAMALATGTGVLSSGNYYYAGGGGGGGYYDGAASAGGTGGGGSGGGGTGSSNFAATAATANTGGGGGGAGNYNAFGTVYAAGAGGSGIVIVRYPV
jgi:hypothetical protein